MRLNQRWLLESLRDLDFPLNSLPALSGNIVTDNTVCIGGNTGIGLEIVKKLSTEYPSYHILMGSRDIHKAEDTCSSLGAPTNINPIQLDVTDDASINHCFKAVEQHFGRLDVLINNAGTTNRDLSGGRDLDNWREIFNHCYNVNVTGAAILTETMLPLLQKSKLPKIIFISSGLGSIANTLRPEAKLLPIPFYSASKTAVNYLAAYYAKKCPHFKVNSCCPGFNATESDYAELIDENDPKNGAINAVRLTTEGPNGATGTYTNKEGPIPW
jgi:NAD(P)-dependent dehydrogenase (short-subunit alcohol dehydrogenase family)